VDPQDSPAAAPHASRPYRPPHQLPIAAVPTAAVPAAAEPPALTPLLEAKADQASARLLAMLLAEIPRHVALAASLQRLKFLTHDDLDELTAKIARAAVRHSEKAKDYCRSDQAMLSYAMRCVRNFVIDFVKMKLRRSTAEEAFALNTEEASDAWSDPEAAMALREMEAAREAAFAALPREHQLVLECIEIQRMSYAETAAHLKMSRSVLKHRLEDARGMLRDAEVDVEADRPVGRGARPKVKPKSKPERKPTTILRLFRTGESDA
jgi:RNA polymerase sigma factor (sigma-70 family)